MTASPGHDDSPPNAGPHPWRIPTPVAIGALLGLATLALRLEGRRWWCRCGRLTPWTGDIWSEHNSQHLFDPYSFTHVEHGLIFYAMLRPLALARPATSADPDHGRRDALGDRREFAAGNQQLPQGGDGAGLSGGQRGQFAGRPRRMRPRPAAGPPAAGPLVGRAIHRHRVSSCSPSIETISCSPSRCNSSRSRRSKPGRWGAETPRKSPESHPPTPSIRTSRSEAHARSHCPPGSSQDPCSDLSMIHRPDLTGRANRWRVEDLP